MQGETGIDGATRSGRKIDGLLAAWWFAITIYFLWEAFSYRGLYAWLAEWQVGAFDWYLPILTFVVPVLLFGIPALLLAASRRRRLERGLRDEEAFTLTRAERLRGALLGMAGAFAFGAIVSLLWSFTLPGFGTPPQQITVSADAPDPVHPSGPAHLNGQVDYRRAALFTQNLIFVRRHIWFAPITGAHATAASPIRYFTELSVPGGAIRPDTRFGVPNTGVLLRNGLPGTIYSLYAGLGVRVPKPYYVLYLSPMTMRWPYYVITIQLAIAALISIVIGGIQHRHVRRRRWSNERGPAGNVIG